MRPTLEVPIDNLVQVCGGEWGSGSATDVGKIVIDYLYGGDRDKTRNRKMWLGQFLVECLERQLQK